MCNSMCVCVCAACYVLNVCVRLLFENNSKWFTRVNVFALLCAFRSAFVVIYSLRYGLYAVCSNSFFFPIWISKCFIVRQRTYCYGCLVNDLFRFSISVFFFAILRSLDLCHLPIIASFFKLGFTCHKVSCSDFSAEVMSKY